MVRYIGFYFFMLFLPSLLFAQAKNDSVQVDVKVPEAIQMLDANNELGKTQKLIVEITEKIKSIDTQKNNDSVIRNYTVYLKNEYKEIKGLRPQSVSKFYLENTYRSWVGYKSMVNAAIDNIRKKMSVYDENLNYLDFELKTWMLTLKEFKSKTDVPDELVQRVKKMVRQISGLKSDIEARQKKLIIKENKLTDLLILTDNALDKIKNMKSRLRTNILAKSAPPLWEIKLRKDEVFPLNTHFKSIWRINEKSFVIYFEQRDFWVIILIWILEVLLFVFIKTRYNSLHYNREKPGFINANFVLNEKRITSLLLILLSTTIVIQQTMPLTLSAVLTVALLALTVILITRFAGERGKQQAEGILILYVLNELEIVFWYFDDLLRLYLVAEAVAGMLLAYYLLGFRWQKIPKDNNPPFSRNMAFFSRIVYALFMVSILANLFGYVNFAVLMTKVSGRIPSILIIIFLLYRMLSVLISAGCEAGKYHKWNVAGYCSNIERNLLRILKLSAIFFIAEFTLDILELYQPVADWVKEAWYYNIAIGTVNISLDRITGMLLIIAVSYFIANVFKVLFENSTYVSKNLSKGTMFAINKTIGYLIIILGYVLGFAYAGIDLGKFTLLAGALGVGIGFGLQNIVNNFISGLILLYERPIEVGDVITVGSLKGEVKSIGVRASKIRSFDGAEVVVPNGNIISNDLINWTLSDRKRRLEINVGVDYGTDPNEVLKILLMVAAKNDKVLVEPQPMALFDGFGESSLNFRLLAWVHFDVSLSVKSELSISVYNALTEAGIGIPFPQMDVHVKEHLTEKPEVVMPKAPDNSPEVIKEEEKAASDKADSNTDIGDSSEESDE